MANKVLCAEKGAEYFDKMKDNQPWATFLDPRYTYNKSLDTCLISYFTVEHSGEDKVYGDIIKDIFSGNTLFYWIHYSIEDKERQYHLNKDICEEDEKCLSREEISKKIDELF